MAERMIRGGDKRGVMAVRPYDSSRFYEQVIRSAQEGVIVFDADLRYAVWNPFMAQLMGVEAGELIGKHTQEVFPHLEAVGVIEAQRQALAGKSVVMPDVFVTSPRTERRHWVSLHYSPLLDEHSQIVGVICIVGDITERKAIEERLRHSQKMEAVGRLAGGIAHDFNNLLTVINGYAAVGLDGLEAPSPQREPLEEILRAGERAAGLTGQLLAYSRKQVLAVRIGSLNAIVSGVQRLLQRLLGADIELVTVLDEELGAVRVDRGQIEQIIMNLAVNARDAMPTGGRLTIETSNVPPSRAHPPHSEAGSGPHVLLAVSDTGSGMTDEVKAHLFEPFFTTKELGRGTGLGLSTVSEIVTQSGGRISVDSEPDRGTRFRIYFPSVGAADVQNAEPFPQTLASREGGEAVLVAEDQDTVRALMSQILRGKGYRVHEASNGREALALFVEGRLDVALVIADLIMPEMGGRELGTKLRELTAPPTLLYMSGHPYPSVVTDDDLQPENFLQKPFSPSELLQKVHEVLERASAMRR